jgi:iron complex transport system substrate-binding protein
MNIKLLSKILVPLVIFVFMFSLNAVEAGSSVGTVTDRLGREVDVPNNPQRVIALAPSITEIIFALGQQYRLAGVTRFSDFPPEAAALPKVGTYVHLDLEKIASLKPDLCLAIKDGNPLAVIERLESLKIPVYAVDPRNLDELLKTIREIGSLLDAVSEANLLIRETNERVEGVRLTVAETSYRPRVFFQIGISPIVSAGTQTFIHELITLAGGINITQGNVDYPRFTREEVISLAPDVFFITTMAREGGFKKIKAQWKRWPCIPAVSNNRLYLIDSNLVNRPTPRLAQGLEILAQHIHPELFEESR